MALQATISKQGWQKRCSLSAPKELTILSPSLSVYKVGTDATLQDSWGLSERIRLLSYLFMYQMLTERLLGASRLPAWTQPCLNGSCAEYRHLRAAFCLPAWTDSSLRPHLP